MERYHIFSLDSTTCFHFSVNAFCPLVWAWFSWIQASYMNSIFFILLQLRVNVDTKSWLGLLELVVLDFALDASISTVLGVRGFMLSLSVFSFPLIHILFPYLHAYKTKDLASFSVMIFHSRNDFSVSSWLQKCQHIWVPFTYHETFVILKLCCIFDSIMNPDWHGITRKNCKYLDTGAPILYRIYIRT